MGTASALAHVGTVNYEACVGTTPFGCQLQNFAQTQSNESWTSADGLQLRCSASHYVTIRATNCAGLQRTIASSATKLCCEPPIRGSAMLHDSSGLKLAYVGRNSASHANLSWTGFSDPCSGIREYSIALRAALAGGTETIWNVSGLLSSESEWLLPSEVLGSLTDGSSYDAVVTATSHAGLQSEAVARFTIDRTAATLGALFNGEMRNVACQPISQPVRISWESLTDPESGIRSVSWAVGLRPRVDDLKAWSSADGDVGEFAREWPVNEMLVEAGTIVFPTLRVVNGAGEISFMDAPPVRLVSPTCGTAYSCLPSSSGTPPWMLPLVMGLSYKISGELRSPKFMGQKLTIDMHVDVHERREADGSRWTRLSIAKNSFLRDLHGSPISHSIDTHLLRHPILAHNAANGTLLELAHHKSDSNGSLGLKEMLVSAQQLAPLAAVRDRPMRGNEWQSLTNVSEIDPYGETVANYSMRKGLLGRVVIEKQTQWSATRARPEVLKQSGATKAIVNRAGQVLHLQSSLHLSFDAASLSSEDNPQIGVEGMEMVPKVPMVCRWELEDPPGDSSSALVTDRRRRLNTLLDSELVSFVRRAPFLDHEPELEEPKSCAGEDRRAEEFMECVLRDESALVDSNKACVHRLAEIATRCPDLDIEGHLEDSLLRDLPASAGVCAAAPSFLYVRHVRNLVPLAAYPDPGPRTSQPSLPHK